MSEGRNAVVAFKRDLGSLIERKELALPSNVSVEAFRNAAVVAVQDNPQILECDTASVFKSVRTLAAAGLVPDGREAALVPFNTRENGRYVKKCQAMPMVFGLVKMARRSGDVTDIRAHLVYQREVDEGRFEYVVGDEEKLEHRPLLFGDRGDPVAVYAIARLKDGSLVREFMSADEVDRIRKAGASQRVKKGDRYAPSDTPVGIWRDHAGEMWKKTVIRRLCKRLDLSAEDMRRMMTDDEQAVSIRDVTPQEPERAAAPRRNLAQRIMEPQEADGGLDGEVMPPEDEAPVSDAENAPDDADSIDTSQAFPGSAEWDEGVKAFQQGAPITDCPHDDAEKQINWLGGWKGAKEAAE